RDNCAEDEYLASKPDPFDERIEVRVNHRSAGFRTASVVDEIEILEHGGADGDDRLGHLAREIKALLGVHHHDGLAVAEDFESGALGLKVFVAGLVEILAEDLVRAER